MGKNFPRQFRVIGIDKTLAKELTDEFKLSAKNDYPDVEPLEDKKTDTKTLILDILAN